MQDSNFYESYPDKLGRDITPGSMVAVAIIRHRTPELVVGECLEIRKSRMNGEPLPKNWPLLVLMPINSDKRCYYEDPRRWLLIKEW